MTGNRTPPTGQRADQADTPDDLTTAGGVTGGSVAAGATEDIADEESTDGLAVVTDRGGSGETRSETVNRNIEDEGNEASRRDV